MIRKKEQILVFMILFSLIMNLSNGVVTNATEANNIIRGTCGENVSYELNKTTGVLRIYGSGAMDDYDAYSVSNPSPWHRDYHSIITKVKVEYGVTSIGENSFRGNPYSEEVYYKNLTSVEIASTVTNIGRYAFCACKNLKIIMIPDSVTIIGDYAFDSTGLTDVHMGSSIETIGNGAFSGTKFTELNLPSSVETIGDEAFSGTKLTELNLPSSIQTVGNEAFFMCSELKTVAIPDNCEVGYRAFADCSALNRAVFGKGCKIHGAVFEQCSQLNQITLGEGSIASNGVVNGKRYSMDYGAFKRCTGLKTILLPDSWGFYDGTEATRAYMDQFDGCINLTNISFKHTNNKYTIIDGVVYTRDKRELVYYPFYLTATEYEMPDSITTIAPYAFRNQEYIENISFSPNINKIGWGAYWGCSKLNHVIIPEGLAELTGSVFIYCTNLESIVLPSSLENIDLNYKAGSHSFGQETMSVIQNIYGEKGSYIEQWAGEKFKEIIFCNFDANGGEVSTKQKPVIYGDKYWKLPTPTRKGYQFLGWYTQKENGNQVLNDTIVSEERSHNLYAHWATDIVARKPINDTVIMLETTIFYYDGVEKKPSVKIKDDSATLTNEVDYTISYADNIEVGTAKVIITGIGNYFGTVSKTFTIALKTKDLAWDNEQEELGLGNFMLPTVSPTPTNGTTVDSNQRNNKVKKVKITISQSKKKGKIFLKWRKLKDVKGYQIQYSLKKNFSKKKIKITKGNSICLKGLESKKRYYIRVRAYAQADKRKWGKWSKVKTIKVK